MAASPEVTRPSTWQLLFGKNKHTEARSNNDDEHEENNRVFQHHEPQSDSPSVSEQLLRALHAREKQAQLEPEQVITSECVEELLGKKNAFASHLRNDSPVDDSDPETMRQAQKIIRSRFKVEDRAEAIRQGKQKEQARREVPSRSRVPPHDGKAERLKTLRVVQQKRGDLDRHEATQLTKQVVSKPVHVTATREAPSRGKETKSTFASTELPKTKVARLVGHQTTDSKAPTTQKSPPIKQTVSKSANGTRMHRDEPRLKKIAVDAREMLQLEREQRVLDERLRQLKVENQELATLEEKVNYHHGVLQVKRHVWSIWRERVERRKRKEASVVQAYRWHLQQRIWSAWRNYARLTRRARFAEITQANLLRDKQAEAQACVFYRRKQLPKLFYQWLSAVHELQEQRLLTNEAIRRREQAQNLLERLARKETSGTNAALTPERVEDHVKHSIPAAWKKTERLAQETGAARLKVRDPKASSNEATRSNLRLKDPPSPPIGASPKEKTNPEAHTKSARSVPSPDPFYLSMQERAAKRKERRDQLKLKYEQQEHEKREALEKQLAEREALLARQKEEERERLREKKREEARRAREKAVQQEILEIQNQSAFMHNRLRLLYHYAFRQWQERWATSKRVAKNAKHWHQLRVCYKVWAAWGTFIEDRRKARRRQERERWDMAAAHHHHAILRSTLTQWKAAQQQTLQLELAVARQVQWNEKKRWWVKWHRQYAVQLSIHQRQEQKLTRHFDRSLLRRVLVAWGQVSSVLKRERMVKSEKEAMWKKVRVWLDD
ncbi:hypothetical protein Poli38472_000392 [Pythium oligandrum]|uniref:Sfi1 spindle body domain-containing protein n=1 Tax=Pythium oligandrum TaxID=41045 RepID=A0A8K1CCL9_PYTOL|nr:hypothetical protein Poli38472_000392 [Pythium oligandrum]|eukprot:TMW60350.1 hypothetical protein Poli38472_000392 [Pythium oligandrum]